MGISPRTVAGKGRGVFFCVCIFSPGEADAVNFLLLPHKWPRPYHWGCLVVLASSFHSRMFIARARVGLGQEEPGPPPPHRLQRAPGEGSLGQRLCFPDSSYVCGSAACAQRAGGADCSLSQHPMKMTTDTEAEGREGAAGQWGWKRRHAHIPCSGLLL